MIIGLHLLDVGFMTVVGDKDRGGRSTIPSSTSSRWGGASC